VKDGRPTSAPIAGKPKKMARLLPQGFGSVGVPHSSRHGGTWTIECMFGLWRFISSSHPKRHERHQLQPNAWLTTNAGLWRTDSLCDGAIESAHDDGHCEVDETYVRKQEYGRMDSAKTSNKAPVMSLVERAAMSVPSISTKRCDGKTLKVHSRKCRTEGARNDGSSGYGVSKRLTNTAYSHSWKV